ncbi:cyclin-like protein [Phellopilus nigrolimitatus]|nr:cyclin-like protein [Phellopilus nigrolimitatus]
MTVELVAPAPDDSQTVTKKPLYEGSTQFQHWRYSEEQLRDIRTSLNTAAVDAIKNAFEIDLPGSSANVSFLTPEEEHLLVKLYIGKVTQLCGHFRFPEEVEATAVSYLKRFYLKNTVMDWHPKNVMLTALFLATKTTNNPISLEAYTTHIPKTAPSDVLDLEFLIAQSLNFEFSVWHAHRALWGIFLDIQNLSDVSLEVLQEAYRSAVKHVRASRLTDAELVYTPSQIGLAAFSLASPDLASSWAQYKGAEAMLSIVKSIEEVIKGDGAGPDVEKVRDVDKRLRLCKNPEKVVGSKAYLAKKAEEETKAMEKRAKKAEGVKRAVEAGDPFGQEVGPKDGTDPDLDDDDD